MTMGLYDITAQRNSGESQSLGDYRGQVLLIVNTASRCGFTPQYTGLQALQDRFSNRGFSVLGFPCDQFGHQEPGSDVEIRGFCDTNYAIAFPLFAKIEVNGDGAHPLYRFLKSERGGLLGSAIKWNFTKFLIGRDGEVLDRFAPQTTPEAIAPAIEKALGAPPAAA
jgi:glutathione peroxidase